MFNISSFNLSIYEVLRPLLQYNLSENNDNNDKFIKKKKKRERFYF